MSIILWSLTTFLGVLAILRVYPSIIKDKLKEIGWKKETETQFILTDVNIFSLVFYPTILIGIQFGVLGALDLLISASILNPGLLVLVSVYSIYFIISFVILFVTSHTYYSNKEHLK